ncbi:hypothetical protein SK128_020230 [Halocaridina rubra]|uniref:C2H2-type domain-containing protein n=1 Tax=Halocaridina rubra TaxID=373956 RepID=A0AAN8WM96_HALRR
METSELPDSLSCKKVKLSDQPPEDNIQKCSELEQKNEPQKRYKTKNKCEKEFKNIQKCSKLEQKNKPQKRYKTKNKCEKEFKNNIKCEVDVQSDSGVEAETTVKKEKVGNSLHDIIIEVETNAFEENEEYTSDDEDKHNLPSKRRRTPSGSIILVYECPFEGCSEEFRRPYRLIEHQRQHTGERPHRCTVEDCDRMYARRQHLLRHIAVSHQKRRPKENLK